MEEYEALYESCLSAPYDMAPWGIFSDFMEENQDREYFENLMFEERIEIIRWIWKADYDKMLLGLKCVALSTRNYAGLKEIIFDFVGFPDMKVRLTGFLIGNIYHCATENPIWELGCKQPFMIKRFEMNPYYDRWVELMKIQSVGLAHLKIRENKLEDMRC